MLLESWSAKYVDSFGNNNFKVTPNFDKIANSGIKFTNFYANGQRSIIGVTAIFSGINLFPQMQYLGNGLELSSISYLGDIVKKHGYSTISMQSSKRGSFRLDSISKLAGFDSYYGAEDMSQVGNENGDRKPRFGTWDGNMYNLLFEKILKTKKPFLSFAFTSTTHVPFISPGKKWEYYSHNNKNIFGFLNTLKYADDKLGKFIQRCKKEPWFDNTIFIFLADHTVGFGNDSKLLKNLKIKMKNRDLEGMRIPLVIYAPKIFKPKVINKVGSQVDIIPTIIDILNIDSTFTTISNSLLGNNAGFALFSRGQTIGYVDNSGYTIHTLKNKLDQTGNFDQEKKIKSIYQTINSLLIKNEWYK